MKMAAFLQQRECLEMSINSKRGVKDESTQLDLGDGS